MLAIREILKGKGREVRTVQGSDSVAEAIEGFSKVKVRALMVTDGAVLIGIVTIRDILNYIARHGASALEAKISAVMTDDVRSVTPDTQLDEAAALFAETGFNHLPVLEEGVLVGVVTPADVLRFHVEDVRGEAGLLRDYIRGVYF